MTSPGKEIGLDDGQVDVPDGKKKPGGQDDGQADDRQGGEELLVGLVRDDVLLGHELDEIGDGLEEAGFAGVGRPHPVLQPGVDLPVEPLDEGGVDEEEQKPGKDDEVENRF